jgi:hypothetical protein
LFDASNEVLELMDSLGLDERRAKMREDGEQSMRIERGNRRQKKRESKKHATEVNNAQCPYPSVIMPSQG